MDLLRQIRPMPIDGLHEWMIRSAAGHTGDEISEAKKSMWSAGLCDSPFPDYLINIGNVNSKSVGYFRSAHSTAERASAIHFFDNIYWNVVRSFPEGRRPTGVSVHHRYPLYTGSQPFTGCRRTSPAMTALSGWGIGLFQVAGL